MIEFGSYNIGLSTQGIDIDTHAMSSVPGLYAAGNVVGNVKGNLAGAAVLGLIAGEHAAECKNCGMVRCFKRSSD